MAPSIISDRGIRVIVCALTVWVINSTLPPQIHAQAVVPVNLGKLGSVVFPTSCSPQAHPHFVRGVAALHSFWYPVALDEFRRTTSKDPDCVMGYWGEAMAHNHPIWGDPQETKAARRVLQNIRITPKVTDRERAYVEAVTILYGEIEKADRDRAYATAMEQVHHDYPNDTEAALFYALALMGSAGEGSEGLDRRLRAGTIASKVLEDRPNHPGAAHYTIHAYDHPKHAHLALHAARRYAEIAPDAPHALHMPSHIFLQLGMWSEAAVSNEASWTASDQWVKRENLPISQRDYHSLHWLMYVYLQQGRYEMAKEQLMLMRESFTRFPKDDPHNLMFGAFTHAAMGATLVVETERWSTANELLPRVEHAGVANTDKGGNTLPIQAYSVVAQIPAFFAHGLAAAANGSGKAQESISKLRAIRKKTAGMAEPFVAQSAKWAEIQELEIEAKLQATKGEFGQAIALMQKASLLMEAMPPPSGPPPVIKPPYELFGEIVLQAGRPNEASEQFAVSLRRHPNRARSLLGAARAAAQSGNAPSAATFYRQFAEQWRPAGAQATEVREAQEYVRKEESRQ